MATSRLPVVVVLGATGVGKSKLAIEIAKVFTGQIISADSMQIYKGLDIISNKVSKEEQCECPHHLISYLEADHKNYNIVDFRDAALPIIDKLLAQRILPIVVGGTNYYIESLLWNTLVDKKETLDASIDDINTHNKDRYNKRKQKDTSDTTNEYLDKVETCSKYGSTSDCQFKADCLKKQKFNEQITHRDITSQDTKSPEQVAFSSTCQQHTTSNPQINAKSALLSNVNRLDIGAISPLELNSNHQHQITTEPNSNTSFTQAYGLSTHSVQISDTTFTEDTLQQSDRITSNLLPPATPSVTAYTADNKHTDDLLYSRQQPHACKSLVYDESQQHTETCCNDVDDLKDVSLSSHCDSPISGSEHFMIHDSVSSSKTSTLTGTGSDLREFCPDNAGLLCTAAGSATQPSTERADKHHELMQQLQQYKHSQCQLLNYLNSLTSTDLYSHLEVIDPITAAHLHPNNQRRIVRAIQVFYENGQTLSSILEEQHAGLENVKSGPLRYPNLCILWIKCQQPNLNERLDCRVDQMMSCGLIDELENFYNEALRLEALKHSGESTETAYYPHGILQMIGFKEFKEYLQLTPQDRNTDDGQMLLQKNIADLKQATRRYAKQQIRWISNRFCNRPGPNVPPIYSVDSTDLTKWDKTLEEAIQVVRAFIMGKVPDQSPEVLIPKVDVQMTRNVCHDCGGRVFLYKNEWADHLKSKKHKANVSQVNKERKKLLGLLTAREGMLKNSTTVSSNVEHAEIADF